MSRKFYETVDLGTNQLVSGVTTGTAPFSITSTTKISNLNSDLHNGFSASATWSAAAFIPATSGSGKLASGFISQVLATTDLTNVTGGTGTGTTLVFSAAPVFTGQPTISDHTNATHNHTNTAGGGTLTHAAVSDFDTQVRTSRIDQMAVPTGAVSMNSQLLQNLATPVSGTDAANKAYVDSNIQGLQPKPTAAAATTAVLPACTYSNGTSGVGATLTGNSNGALAAIDGYTASANDILLVKNQASAFQNGLYVVTTVGTGSVPFVLTRHIDMDTTGEFSGSFVPVGSAGTINANSLWLANPSGAITVGTTNIPFTQLNGATDLIAGNGTNITGNTISVVTDSRSSGTKTTSITSNEVRIDSAWVGQNTITTLGTITTGVWTGTAVAVANGGTGATSSASARSNLSSTSNPLPQKYSVSIGDNSTTAFTITHNLGTQDVIVMIHDTSSLAEVEADIVMTTTNTVTVTFNTAPTTNQFRVKVIG